jgi:hypothetical protein
MTMTRLWYHFSLESIICGVAMDAEVKEEMSGHAYWTGATLSHACSAGATHDISSMVASTIVLTRVMRISVSKVDKRFDGGDGFLLYSDPTSSIGALKKG